MREVILRHIYFSRAPCTQCFVPFQYETSLRFCSHHKVIRRTASSIDITLSSFRIIPTKIDRNVGHIIPAFCSLGSLSSHLKVKADTIVNIPQLLGRPAASTFLIPPHFLLAARVFVTKGFIPFLGNAPAVGVRRSNTVLHACISSAPFDVPLSCS